MPIKMRSVQEQEMLQPSGVSLGLKRCEPIGMSLAWRSLKLLGSRRNGGFSHTSGSFVNLVYELRRRGTLVLYGVDVRIYVHYYIRIKYYTVKRNHFYSGIVARNRISTFIQKHPQSQ